MLSETMMLSLRAMLKTPWVALATFAAMTLLKKNA